MVEDGAYTHKKNYVPIFFEIQNLEGHYWFKSYGNFAELVVFSYSAINRSTPSSLSETFIFLQVRQWRYLVWKLDTYKLKNYKYILFFYVVLECLVKKEIL